MATLDDEQSHAMPQPPAVARYAIDWTSDAEGDAEVQVPSLRGTILRASFKPGSGSAQPTDAYDVTLLDPEGIDVLSGGGANLSNTDASTIIPVETASGLPFAIAGPMTLVVENAGNAKSGRVVLYVR